MQNTSQTPGQIPAKTPGKLMYDALVVNSLGKATLKAGTPFQLDAPLDMEVRVVAGSSKGYPDVVLFPAVIKSEAGRGECYISIEELNLQ